LDILVIVPIFFDNGSLGYNAKDFRWGDFLFYLIRFLFLDCFFIPYTRWCNEERR